MWWPRLSTPGVRSILESAMRTANGILVPPAATPALKAAAAAVPFAITAPPRTG